MNRTTNYDYHNMDGSVEYRVVRIDKANGEKDIYQRRPNGKGGWLNNLEGVEKVLYRQHLLPHASTVYVVEGEKCADALNGLLDKAGLCPDTIATTNSGGAGNWKDTYNEHLLDKVVVVFADNDTPGHRHAEQVCNAIEPYAVSVKMVLLDGLPDKGDIVDWIEVGGTMERLAAVIYATPEWSTLDAEVDAKVEFTDSNDLQLHVPSESEADDDLPEVQTNGRQLRDIIRDSLRVLVDSNKPACIFRRGTSLAKVSTDEHGRPFVTPFSASAMKTYLAWRSNWVMVNGQGRKVPTTPPKDVVDSLLHWHTDEKMAAEVPHMGIPPLVGIVTAPVFAPDKTLRTEHGYDAATRLYFHSEPQIKLGDTTPSNEALSAAKALLLDELLGEFPFVDNAARAHALALLLLPFVRHLIDGPTPLHVLDAPMAGTGKGLLALACALPFIGREPSVMTSPHTEDEWRKRITSTLYAAPSHVLIDNARVITSKELAAVLTSSIWEDRRLGVSENITIPVRSIWMATTNNTVLSYEMTRRTVWIRLDSKSEQPYLRQNFRHANLRGWALEHRSELVTAALTLIYAWVKAGSPSYDGPNTVPGSFESWGHVMGGILDVINVPGFLDNAKTLYDNADTRTLAWREFVKAWHEQHGEKPVAAKGLIELANVHIPDEIEGGRSDNAPSIKLGKRLKEYQDRIFGDFKIVNDRTYQGAMRYKAIKVDGEIGESRESVEQDNGPSNQTTANPTVEAESVQSDAPQWGYPDVALPPTANSIDEWDDPFEDKYEPDDPFYERAA